MTTERSSSGLPGERALSRGFLGRSSSDGADRCHTIARATGARQDLYQLRPEQGMPICSDDLREEKQTSPIRLVSVWHCWQQKILHPAIYGPGPLPSTAGSPSILDAPAASGTRLFASVWDKMVSRPILLQPVKAATPATVCRTNSAIELLLLHRRLFPVLFLGTKRSSAIAVGALMSRPPEPTARSGCAVQSDLAPSEGAIKLRSVLDRSRLRVAPDCCAMD